MFFVTYLRGELRRKRQATFIAPGLALGVGLVMTVSSASAGVMNAPSDVLGEGLGCLQTGHGQVRVDEAERDATSGAGKP